MNSEQFDGEYMYVQLQKPVAQPWGSRYRKHPIFQGRVDLPVGSRKYKHGVFRVRADLLDRMEWDGEKWVKAENEP